MLPFCFILNYAVGGLDTWPGYLDSQFPGCMEINWIRIVQK